MSKLIIWRWVVLGCATAVILISFTWAVVDSTDGTEMTRGALNGHIMVRFLAMLGFLAGGLLWVAQRFDREIRQMGLAHVPVRREPIYMGIARPLAPATTADLREPARHAHDKRPMNGHHPLDPQYLADVAEAVALGRELERRKPEPPEDQAD